MAKICASEFTIVIGGDSDGQGEEEIGDGDIEGEEVFVVVTGDVVVSIGIDSFIVLFVISSIAAAVVSVNDMDDESDVEEEVEEDDDDDDPDEYDENGDDRDAVVVTSDIDGDGDCETNVLGE